MGNYHRPHLKGGHMLEERYTVELHKQDLGESEMVSVLFTDNCKKSKAIDIAKSCDNVASCISDDCCGKNVGYVVKLFDNVENQYISF